jgi:hypothetical protein
MRFNVLPGEGENTNWFYNLNAFEQAETIKQVRYKRLMWPELHDGLWAKRPSLAYPHILPVGNFDKAVYPPIADEVAAYCGENDIAIHTEILNLRSSQASCFNLLFPLRKDKELAARVLKPLLPNVAEVKEIEFEYTGGKAASTWLGEVGGKRGQNCTSIDAAIWWGDCNGISTLTLVEWKYTERSFGTCGGYSSTGNKQKHLCKLQLSGERCYLKCKKGRRYWEHLSEAGVDVSRLSDIEDCPFKGPFYQLMRQFVLAAYLRKGNDGKNLPIDRVNVASVSFRENRSIHAIPRELSTLGDNVVAAWNHLLGGVPKLMHVDVEDIVMELKKEDCDAARDLGEYLNLRYGL